MNYKNTLIFLLFCILTACAGNEHQMSLNYWKEGKKHEEMQRYDSATFYYRKALDILGNKNDDKLKGELYNGLGNVFSKVRLYHESFLSYKEAQKYNSRLTDKTNLSLSLRGMGKSFAFQHKPDSAVNYFLKASELSPFVKDTTELLLINNNLSAVYQTLGEYDRALHYNDIALSLSNDSIILCKNLQNRGNIFMGYGQYDSARYYYEAASHSRFLQTKAASYWRLYGLYSTLQLPDSSKYLKLFTILNDSIDRTSQIVQVESMEKKYLKSKAESKYKRSLLYIFSLFLLPISLFIWFIWRYRSKLDKQRKMVRKYEETFALEQASGSAGKPEEKFIEHVEKFRKLKEAQNKIIESLMSAANDCTVNFKKTDEYKLIREKLKNNPSQLNKADMEDIFETVVQAYQSFITRLSHYVPVSIDDSYLCCLSLCRLSSQESAVLRGISQDSIRSQKRRIKSKFAKVLPTSELFKFIFETKEK